MSLEDVAMNKLKLSLTLKKGTDWRVIAPIIDDPLTRVSRAMKWHIEFSPAEITELQKFVTIMASLSQDSQKFVKSKFIDCSPFICNFLLHRVGARPASLRGGARGYQYRVRHSWAAIPEQETRHRSE